MKRRGFTLIELVVSLGVMGVLSLALASTILLSTRALPNAGGGPENQAAAGRALQILGADIRLAKTVAMPDSRTLTLTIADQTGDAAEESITYAWDNSIGSPFTRTYNGNAVPLVSSISDLKFQALKRPSVKTDVAEGVPTDRIRVSFSTANADPTDVTGEFRLLNARAP